MKLISEKQKKQLLEQLKQSDCVSNKIRILQQQHPDWDHDQIVAVAYAYCDNR